MNKPKFSCVLIGRNERNTLPRMANSLKEFMERGGEAILVDTGSTDGTADVARDLGFIVYEEGDKFKVTIDKELCDKINEKFIVDNEEPVVKEGDTLFDFAAARNYAATKATNDWVAMPDCDESYTKLDIDKVNESILDESIKRLVYDFVFAHDKYGNPLVQFQHSKIYNRKKVEWRGVVHECLFDI